MFIEQLCSPNELENLIENGQLMIWMLFGAQQWTIAIRRTINDMIDTPQNAQIHSLNEVILQCAHISLPTSICVQANTTIYLQYFVSTIFFFFFAFIHMFTQHLMSNAAKARKAMATKCWSVHTFCVHTFDSLRMVYSKAEHQIGLYKAARSLRDALINFPLFEKE